MEKLARRIGAMVADSAKLEGERREVMIYGFLALFQTSVIFGFSLLLSIPCAFAVEAIIIFLAVGLIRRCTGGVHSSSMLSCTVQSCVVICAAGSTARYLLPVLTPVFFASFAAVVGIAALALIYLKAPMDTANKRIKSPEKRKRLRKSSFAVAIIAVSLSALSYAAGIYFGAALPISAAYALLLALAWQSFTLTPLCAAMTMFIDRLFERAE